MHFVGAKCYNTSLTDFNEVTSRYSGHFVYIQVNTEHILLF